MDALRLMQLGFRERIRAPRWWSWLALVAPRLALGAALALLPAAALLAAILWAPSEVGRAITSPQGVREFFMRFIGAVATASAIAVSMAQLVLRRELKGLRTQEQRHEANLEYRDRVRAASGRGEAPLSLSAFLALAFDALRDATARARGVATREEMAARVGDVGLGAYLDTLDRVAQRCAVGVRAAAGAPERLASAMMDFEEEMTSALARRAARDERVSPATREAIVDVEARIHDIVLGAKYAKTLGTQWGLGRMSIAITVATLPAIVVAAGMSLAYGEGARAAWGTTGAGALVGAALAVVLFPIAFFVSEILRFVFLHQYTLPTEAFVLGPEEPAIAQGERRGATSRARLGT